MYSSVKFFVANVTEGFPAPGSSVVRASRFVPDPQPDRINKTASAVARRRIAVILTGSLDGSHLGAPFGHRTQRRRERLVVRRIDRELDVDGENLEVLAVGSHAAELLEQPQHRLVG